jgi:hypothetical protein
MRTNILKQEFISEMGKELEVRQDRPIKGGVLLSDDIKILAPDLFSTGNFLYYFTSEVRLTNLSAIEMFQNVQKDSYFTSPGKSFLPLVPIYNFEEENEIKGVQSKIAFAKKYNLDVLIFSGKYQIEKEWSEFSEKVIVDPTTQEKIMFLKR